MKRELVNGKLIKRSGDRKAKISPLTAVLLTVFIIYCVIMFVLLIWAVGSTFRDFDNFGRYPLIWTKPGAKLGDFRYVQLVGFKNYSTVIYVVPWITDKIAAGAKTSFAGVLVNSVLYALGCAFFQTLVPCLTAYICSRYKFKFSRIVYTTAIVVMTIPVVGSLPSELAMAINLKLYNHIWGLWIMKANFLGMYFLVLYEMFNAIPITYYEAASIDGASDLQQMIHIGLPLCRNTFMTVLLINFITYWNDYQIPLVYLRNKVTIARYLFEFRNMNSAGPAELQGRLGELPIQVTAAVIMVVPTVLLFICFQKRLLGNLTIGGIKG